MADGSQQDNRAVDGASPGPAASRPGPSSCSARARQSSRAEWEKEAQQFRESIQSNFKLASPVCLGEDGKWRLKEDGSEVEVQVMVPKSAKAERPKEPGIYRLPPGEYLIGDVLVYTSEDNEDAHGVFSSQGLEGPAYMVGPTAYGDGLFRGSNGRDYSVDSGHLGIVDAKLAGIDDIANKKSGWSSLHHFTSDVSVEYLGGKFKFSSKDMQLDIDTSL